MPRSLTSLSLANHLSFFSLILGLLRFIGTLFVDCCSQRSFFATFQLLNYLPLSVSLRLCPQLAVFPSLCFVMEAPALCSSHHLYAGRLFKELPSKWSLSFLCSFLRLRCALSQYIPASPAIKQGSLARMVASLAIGHSSSTLFGFCNYRSLIHHIRLLSPLHFPIY